VFNFQLPQVFAQSDDRLLIQHSSTHPSSALIFDNIILEEETLFGDDQEELDRLYRDLKEKAARMQSLKKNQDMFIDSKLDTVPLPNIEVGPEQQ
jgi:hypothetical protein